MNNVNLKVLLKSSKIQCAIFIVCCVFVTSCITTQPVVYERPAPVQPAPEPVQPQITLQTFYEELAPYGQWVNMPNRGYVWFPSVGLDFVPYSTAGYWAYTSCGWTWVSDYSWGWAAFHYGLWDYDSFMGWFWIPNTVWGPAWVSWRSSPGYYGWAPLTPEYNYGNPGGSYYIPPERYVFVQTQYMGSTTIYQNYAPRSEYQGYMRNSAVINNTYYDNDRHVNYMSGPNQAEVERYSGRPVTPVTFSNNAQPGHASMNGSQLNLYRPAAVTKAGSANVTLAPAHVAQLSEVKPVSQRPVIADKPRPVNSNLNPATNPARVNEREKEGEIPGRKAPVEQTPVEQVPVQKSPIQKAPAQQTPLEKAPVQQAPIQKTPAQHAPVEQAPVQKAPAPAQQKAKPANKKPNPKPEKASSTKEKTEGR